VYERYFASTYRLSLSGYTYDIDGLITQVEDEFDMQFFANMDDVRARGVEMELEAIYQNGAILRGSWAIQRAEDVASGLELTNSPHQLVKFTGSMPLFGTPVFANLDVQYNSESITLTRTRSPSFVLANFTLNTHELWSGVELTAGVYNILDEDRRFPGAEEHVQETLPQEGRTYGGRFIVKF
jgi:iron complex outermembrane receptor protein